MIVVVVVVVVVIAVVPIVLINLNDMYMKGISCTYRFPRNTPSLSLSSATSEVPYQQERLPSH